MSRAVGTGISAPYPDNIMLYYTYCVISFQFLHLAFSLMGQSGPAETPGQKGSISAAIVEENWDVRAKWNLQEKLESFKHNEKL